VSPYRAEGFNLTPLEAAACGIPIVVTKGGSTDDYFHESFGSQIEGNLVRGTNRTYIEPSLDNLILELQNVIEGRVVNINQSVAIALIQEKFTWKAVTNLLANEFNS
jgi:glycosyltransferase involved in cell wall biosynthesis